MQHSPRAGGLPIADCRPEDLPYRPFLSSNLQSAIGNLQSGVVLAAIVLFLTAAAPARADLIFLKDGFTIHGKVKKENTRAVDPFTRETYNVPKGFFFVDGGARRYFFSPAQVQATDHTFLAVQDTVNNFQRIIIPGPVGMPIILDIADAPEFNDKWTRTLTYRTVGRNVVVPQRLQYLSSSYAVVDAANSARFLWTSCYLPEELGFDQVRRLLAAHKDFADPPTLPAAMRSARRLRLYRFLVHAGWLKEADAELDGIVRDLPGEKKKVEEERERLRRLQAVRLVENIQRGHRAGRHKWVLEQLVGFPEKYAPAKAVDEFRTLQATYKASGEKIKEAERLMVELLKDVKGSDQRKLFTAAVAVIRAEMHRDSIDRLDTFVDQARRQLKLKPKNGPTAAELLSLAVTGWLQGSASSQAKPDAARQFWDARNFALAYLKNDNEADRQALLAGYASQKNALGVDEVAQMITLLPPPRAESRLPERITKQTTNNVTYELQLPREYNHGRAYPLLIVLHHSGEGARDMLKRWADRAGREGYILAAPHWQQGAGASYNYSAAEHATVLDTLRDLRLRFHVDCDRVFLFGLGQGGNMAYDVGLAHPDLFAGILPMAATPELFVRQYWPNAQYLPFYIVGGDHVGEPNKLTREQLEKWIPHGYPVLYVQYKGRGMEWFGAEVAPMFDWMGRKKRTTPVTQLGRYGQDTFGDMFRTMRETDNCFYWLSTDSIGPQHLNNAARWRAKLPATVCAHIDPANNRIFIYHTGLRQITVWLARDAKVNFAKPLTVRVNGTIKVSGRTVQPSLSTMLEDYYRRGDRQQLFVARIELKP